MGFTDNDLIFGIVLVVAIAIYGIVARICETIRARYQSSEEDNDET